MGSGKSISVCLVVCSLALGGCSFYDASRVEADFGHSVRQMVQEQIHDNQAASNPSEELPQLNGELQDELMKKYLGISDGEGNAEKSLTINTQ